MRRRDWDLPAPATVAVLLAVAAVTLATAVHARYLGPVVRETAKALEYAAAFCFAALACRRADDERIFGRVLALLVLGVAVLALAQEWGGAPSVFRAGTALVPRIAGPLEGPNQLAGFLGLAAPLLAALWPVCGAAWCAPALIAALATEVLTFSRAGIATTALALGLFFILERRAGSRALAAGAGFGAGMAAALSIAGQGILHLTSTADEGDTGAVGHRGELWRAAWFFFRRSPWIGIGAGNYERDLPLAGLHGIKTHANSRYLQALAEGGFALELATLAAVVIPLRQLWLHARTDALARAVFCAGVGFALHDVVDDLYFFPKIAVFWWLCAGFALARKT